MSRGRGGRGTRRQAKRSPVRHELRRPPGHTCKTEARESTIPGAGLGLFMLEDARPGDRVAIYTGAPLTAAEAATSTSPYLFQVNKNLVLDAQDPTHANGRYVNDGPIAGREANARFGAARFAVTCKETGRPYVSIRATKNIAAGAEVLVSYGRGYWGKGGFSRDGTLAELQPGHTRQPGVAVISASPAKGDKAESALVTRAAPVLRVWRNPVVKDSRSAAPQPRTQAPQRVSTAPVHVTKPVNAACPGKGRGAGSASAGTPLRRN